MICWWLWNWFCIFFWSVMENCAKCKIQLLHQNYQIPCCEIWNIWRCGFSERVCAAYQVWNQTSHKRISFHSLSWNNNKTIKSFIHFITHTEFLESSIFSHDYFPPSPLLSFHIKWNLQMCPASVFILTLKKWEAPVTAARQQITEIQNFHFLLKSEASLIFPFHNLHFLIFEWRMRNGGDRDRALNNWVHIEGWCKGSTTLLCFFCTCFYRVPFFAKWAWQ